MVPLHIRPEYLPQATSLVEFLREWHFFSLPALVLAVAVGAYLLGLLRLSLRTERPPIQQHRAYLALLALAILAVALIGPFDRFSGEAFWIHMTQHLLLMMIAAPLLLAANPAAAYMWALPAGARARLGASLARQGALQRFLQTITDPRAALIIYIGTLWAWHIPAAYQLALRNALVHDLEHLTMFAASVIFWWPIIGSAPIRSRLTYPQRIVYLLLALTPMSALGAFITYAHNPLYPVYELSPDHWGIGAMEDQAISGVIMWIPGGKILLLALTILFFKWFADEERKSRSRRRPGPQTRGAGERIQGLNRTAVPPAGETSTSPDA